MTSCLTLHFWDMLQLAKLLCCREMRRNSSTDKLLTGFYNQYSILKTTMLLYSQVKEVAFLGVVLDGNLTWKPHIANVSRKISKSIGIIYKSSFCLPKSSLITLYYRLAYPYLLYCVSVWGSTYPTNLNRFLLLQKRVVRTITKHWSF